MANVAWQKDGSVAIMTMSNGGNLNNPEWAKDMLTTYTEIESDQEVKALVLTSNDSKNFCLGVDVEWVYNKQQAGDYPAISDWLYANGKVFRAMIMAPFPTIAAVTGHAFGNGAMLAGACDFRFMRADRGYFCFPEIDLGIQLAPAMIKWMQRIMPYHLLQRMLLSGEKITASELEKYGTIIKACENSEKTVEEAVAYAKTFNKSRTTMAEMKNRLYKPILDAMENEDPLYYDYRPELAKEGKMPVFMMTPLT
ncbi:MAG: enoyl-CoA hydratase/isomerase family protein [Syntrophomonadaceae bacterium]|jgi:enoyl-CoA hydratase/carnithine racemase|nr:enoyl-CoA hydratase/isomerase family protein [Bacillota bacterium]